MYKPVQKTGSFPRHILCSRHGSASPDKKCAWSAPKLIFLPFLCWNRQIWSNFDKFVIILGETGATEIFFGGKCPVPPYDAVTENSLELNILGITLRIYSYNLLCQEWNKCQILTNIIPFLCFIGMYIKKVTELCGCHCYWLPSLTSWNESVYFNFLSSALRMISIMLANVKVYKK